MRQYTYLGMGTRIFVLFLLLILLLVGGFIWFDFLGLIDGKETLAPILGVLGMHKRTILKDKDDPLLLERERLNKQLEAVSLLEEELARREEELKIKEGEISQMVEDIKEQEKALEDRENSFNERLESYDIRRRNIKQSSEYLVGMPPENAVKILLAMDDIDVIDIFRITEEVAQEEDEVSLVAYWLSLMPKERAAELSRKMARK